MPEPAHISFLIRRMHVQLKVDLLANGLVHIQPYQCAEKNLRLWKGISQAQAVWAQFNLNADKKASPRQVLVAHFERKGWAVAELES